MVNCLEVGEMNLLSACLHFQDKGKKVVFFFSST